jgi:hypothetical protein
VVCHEEWRETEQFCVKGPLALFFALMLANTLTFKSTLRTRTERTHYRSRGVLVAGIANALEPKKRGREAYTWTIRFDHVSLIAKPR